jgi:hypothetical protein
MSKQSVPNRLTGYEPKSNLQQRSVPLMLYIVRLLFAVGWCIVLYVLEFDSSCAHVFPQCREGEPVQVSGFSFVDTCMLSHENGR